MCKIHTVISVNFKNRICKSRVFHNWVVVKSVKCSVVGPPSMLQYVSERDTCPFGFRCCSRSCAVWLKYDDIQSSTHHNSTHPTSYGVFRYGMMRSYIAYKQLALRSSKFLSPCNIFPQVSDNAQSRVCGISSAEVMDFCNQVGFV